MKKIIQKVIEKLIADGWLIKNEHLVDEAVPAAIEDAMREIKVKDFLDAFYD